MQHVEEGGDSIASRLTDFSFLNKSLIEKHGGILLLLAVLIAAGFLSFGFLLGRHAWDIKSHFDKLVLSCTCLFTPATRTTELAVSTRVAGVKWKSHLDSNLIAASQVGVANLRVGQLKRWLVLNAKGDFGLGEFGFAPIPASKGVLLVF